MADRTYNIPLRKEWQKVPIHSRTPKAVRAVRAFMQRHMKSEDVRLGKYLNEELWKSGNRRPPHHVSVTAEVVDDKEGKYVKVELVGAPEEEKPKEEKKKGILDKLKGEKKENLEEEVKEAIEEEKEEKPAEAPAKKEKPKTETKKAPKKEH
ncbi:hypothetical protein FJZ53_02835 [Candidatus Woesearchaeota archaeon]|nr:hypothetical protein [Candidatus Woesearchaeota archaeon]